MAPVTLPPGFRFHPTDEELVSYYLERKITGKTIELEIIPDVDLYKFEPWDLPDKSFLPSKDLEWYFYSPRDRKYPNESRTNRATKGGYWKATGKDRLVHSNRRPVGMKKTLVYYRGRAPYGIRTNWVMHEYRLLESVSGTASSSLKDSYALCRIFKKTIQISKAKGDQTEDTKKETTWGTYDQKLGENSNAIEISREEEIPEKFSHDISYKLHCDASSSDVTQGTPAETAVADDLQVQFGSDEANSSAASQYSISMDFTSELFQDLQLPFYASLPYHLPHLQIEDFSQMNVADTKFLKTEETDHDQFLYDSIEIV